MSTKIQSNNDHGLKIKYLNIILLTLILSSLINGLIFTISLTYSVSLNSNPLIFIIISLPFVLGGILSGFIKEGSNGVLGGLMVGGLSMLISLNISLLLYGFITLPSSEWNFYIPLGIIYMTPIFLVAGAVLGLIGGIVGVLCANRF